MKTFQGIPVSPGVTIAPAFLRRPVAAMPPRHSVAKSRIPDEIERFQEAVEKARAELDALASETGLAEAVSSIAAGHREFLRDWFRQVLTEPVVPGVRLIPRAARRWLQDPADDPS